MSIQIALLDQDRVGQEVVYTDHAGKKEYGVISSWNQSYVFVKYHGGQSSKATGPDRLDWANTENGP